jgi:SNF2 family DNA or RNA helicase
VKLSRSDLHTYQQAAVEFMLSRGSCALWMDLGLGKTAAALTGFERLWRSAEIAQGLVISTVRVSSTTWPLEGAKWDHLSHLRIVPVTGTPKQRTAALKQRAAIHTISFENVVWLVDTLKAQWPFDFVIIDESTAFKNAGAKRFRALRRALKYITKVVELTATPRANGLEDLWAQVYLLDQGGRLGRTITAFRHEYFHSQYNGFTTVYTPRRGAEAEVAAKLEGLCLAMREQDHLRMTAPLVQNVTVRLPARTRSQYQDLERDFVTALDSGDPLVVETAPALANKLRQMATGAVYTDAERNWEELHNAKLDALAELAAEAQGAPLFVAYWFRPDRERLLARFPQAVFLDRDPETQARWNRGEIQMLIAHPRSAGHGLNLQAGGHIVVWFSPDWSGELYRQFNARLRRQGQNKRVQIYHILAKDTVDATILSSALGKIQSEAELMLALRDSILTKEPKK